LYLSCLEAQYALISLCNLLRNENIVIDPHPSANSSDSNSTLSHSPPGNQTIHRGSPSPSAANNATLPVGGDGQKSRLSSGAIAGVAVGATSFALIIVVGLVFAFVFASRRSRKQPPVETAPVQPEIDGAEKGLVVELPLKVPTELPDSSPVELDAEKIMELDAMEMPANNRRSTEKRAYL
jgi:hypothetical protein